MKRVAVIGGGASGMMAACFAAGGNRVVLFEKQNTLGKKILVTGNGRCNISNRNISLDKYNGKNPEFVLKIFSKFGLAETIGFFESIGIPMTEGKNGKLFPASLQASAVAKIFSYELKRRNVDVKSQRKVESIICNSNSFTLTTAGKESHEFDSVILAAGSCAFPRVGGSESGLDLARSQGHKIIEPFPAILPLNIPLKTLHRLQGTKWDCEIKCNFNGKLISSSEGELLFTGYGISGTAVLDISRDVNSLACHGKNPEIIIDFFPGISESDLMNKFEKLWGDGAKKLSFSLIGLLNEKIPEIILKIAGIDPDSRVSSLSQGDKKKIVKAFKYFALSPGKPRPFNEAVVAAGGVDVDEINPSTMESKLVKNFFITGELLDIDGESGGYNLQFAWSTGAIAGMNQ